MKVKIKNKDNYLKEEYEVYGIVTFNKKEHYILIAGENVRYFSSNEIIVIDNNITEEDWVYISFLEKFRLKSYYDVFGYDYIDIERFLGPKCFIDDKLFLLNILVDTHQANNFMYLYIKKLKKDNIPNLRLV